MAKEQHRPQMMTAFGGKLPTQDHKRESYKIRHRFQSLVAFSYKIRQMLEISKPNTTI